MNELLNKSQKSVKSMGFSLIAVSFLFYFIPDFALIDVLPDIITYILICIGISKLSYLNESLDSARKLFFRMILVSAGKIVALFVTFGTSNTDEQSSLMLLMVFVFALMEGLILIPAYIHLFDGLLYLGTRYDGVAVFGKKKDRMKKSASDRLKNQTIVFIIVKNVMLVLPETAALSISDSIGSYNMGMYEFIPHMRILGMIVSLIFGIVWIISIISYFRSLKNDRDFEESLCRAYNTEILPNEKIFIERRMSIACLFLCVGVALAMDFYIDGNDGYNIIPDILFALVTFFGMFMIKKYISQRILMCGGVACALYGIVSSVNWKLTYDFMQTYTTRQILRKAEAFNQWRGIIILTIVEAVLFLSVVAFIFIALKKMVENHTGYSVDNPMIDSTAKISLLHKKLLLPLYFSFALGVFAAAGGVFRVSMFATLNDISNSSWLVEDLFTLFFVGTLIYAIVRINNEVKEKYMY